MARQPVIGPGWAPVTAPPRNPLWPVAREVAILGVLALAALMVGVLAIPRGWLAVLLSWALLHVYGTHRGRRFRTGVEWIAVGVLGAMVAAALVQSPNIKAPRLKAPVTVDAAQADSLDRAREIWAAAWERLAKGFPRDDQAKPKAKGHH